MGDGLRTAFASGPLKAKAVIKGLSPRRPLTGVSMARQGAGQRLGSSCTAPDGGAICWTMVPASPRPRVPAFAVGLTARGVLLACAAALPGPVSGSG